MCEVKKSGGSAMWLHRVSLIFGVAGIALAVAAEGIMLTVSQCTVYTDYGVRPRTITYRDFHEFVYLVAATPIAVLLEAVAVFLSVSKKRRSKKAARVLALAAIELLSTSASTAIDAGRDISYYLEPSGRRVSLCHSRIGAHFCAQVHVSMWLELGAAVAVSTAEILTMLRWCRGSDSCSDSCSDYSSEPESDSETVCGHGCHCRH